ACGVPILSSNSGGGARYLLEKNTGGLIFENREEVIEQLLQLYENPDLRAKMAAQGRERVMRHFNIEKEVNAYKELYLSLLK
ncbi:MAG: glycosyltransferase, partial [Flavobacteriaceae bacterium]|nr:glycosyltransferase [Flavobacteriaceae bacterium]